MRSLSLTFALMATPALAADKPFFSLANTDFIVLLGFLLFIGILIYFKVPGMITGLLDKRAEDIRAELDEARKLREEAQTVLASYERKQREVQSQADEIVAHARDEAALAAEQAKADIAASIERRLQAAEDRIASAQASALRDVRDSATEIAMAAAAEVIGKQMDAARADSLIDDAIATVDAKLH
ncbi:MAG: F0F1 ATP synthase subunit B [Rhodobacteraceae bacterium]|nr:F0F1 ATP synthase subunit B [Alphaproteobacteria bacterium]MBT8475661.1 F0F1 ATP synthase subunit B [Alphaproteobacteria bacterium]NNK66144.1 F0F1 ATP synthase subunit B [Paracoccaceae bacterium]